VEDGVHGRANDTRFLAGLLAAATLLRLLALTFFEGEAGDAVSRTSNVVRWLHHPAPWFGRTIWAPLNYVIPALPIALTGESYWSVRLTYIGLAVAGIALVYLLARDLLGDESAKVAGVLVACNPYHIVHSSNGANAEIPGILLVTLAIHRGVLFQRDRRIRDAVLSGMAIATLTLVRYEAVIWGAAVGLCLLLPVIGMRPAWRESRLRLGFLCYSVMAMIGGLVLLGAWYRAFGDPFYILRLPSGNTMQFFDAGSYRDRSILVLQSLNLLFYPLSSFVVLSPVVAALAFIGLGVTVRSGRGLMVLVPAVTVMLFLIYETTSHTLTAHFRYALVFSLLLTPFVASGMTWIQGRKRKLRSGSIWLAMSASVLLTYGFVVAMAMGRHGILTRHLTWVSPIRRNAYATGPIVEWARANLGTGRLLIMPCIRSSYLELMGDDMIEQDRVRVLTIYRTDNDVYTRAEMVAAVMAQLPQSTHLLVDVECRELAYRDGIGPEVVPPADASGTVRMGESYRLAPLQRSGTYQLYAISRDQALAPAGHVPLPLRGSVH
jgi:hypothetical protein